MNVKCLACYLILGNFWRWTNINIWWHSSLAELKDVNSEMSKPLWLWRCWLHQQLLREALETGLGWCASVAVSDSGWGCSKHTLQPFEVSGTPPGPCEGHGCGAGGNGRGMSEEWPDFCWDLTCFSTWGREGPGRCLLHKHGLVRTPGWPVCAPDLQSCNAVSVGPSKEQPFRFLLKNELLLY